MFEKITNWIKARLTERTTLDGAVIVAISLSIILFKNLIWLMAWPALAYGIWTAWKGESRG